MNELEKLLAEATPGTWSVTEDGDIRCEQIVTEDGETYTESCSIATGQCSQNWGYIHWGKLEDAALICAAVNALPELLAKVKRLEEALATIADPAAYSHSLPSCCQHTFDDTCELFSDIARAALSQETKP